MFVQQALIQELRHGKRHWLDKARTLQRLEQVYTVGPGHFYMGFAAVAEVRWGFTGINRLNTRLSLSLITSTSQWLTSLTGISGRTHVPACFATRIASLKPGRTSCRPFDTAEIQTSILSPKFGASSFVSSGLVPMPFIPTQWHCTPNIKS